jgi:hypothetical protein
MELNLGGLEMKNIFLVGALLLTSQSVAFARLQSDQIGVFRCPVPAGVKVVEISDRGGVPFMHITFANQDTQEGAASVYYSRERATTTLTLTNQLMVFNADSSVTSNGFACQKD